MIRFRGDLAIITDKNPGILDGYRIDKNDIHVQRRIMKPCEYRTETHIPGTCCGNMSRKMRLRLDCLIFEKEVTSAECGECHEHQ